ncbi:MAG: DsrE family protein [Chloroflexi bacterium]|nr:DsrE family protein [Chloroflexota bacterium]
MKTLTVFLTTPPYSHENTHSAIQLTRAALDRGWMVNLFASADGVYNFTRGHKAQGLPHAEHEFADLMARGLHVELCGTCLHFRGISAEHAAPGAEPSSMKRLFGLAQNSDVFVTLGA